MRFKYFKIGGGGDVKHSSEAVYMDIKSPTITTSYPFQSKVIDNRDFNRPLGSSDEAFEEVNNGLYQRVVKRGKKYVPVYGNDTDYIMVLPESHPGFNFDLFYIQYCTGYGVLEHMHEEEDFRDIILYTFPEFVEASKD